MLYSEVSEALQLGTEQQNTSKNISKKRRIRRNAPITVILLNRTFYHTSIQKCHCRRTRQSSRYIRQRKRHFKHRPIQIRRRQKHIRHQHKCRRQKHIRHQHQCRRQKHIRHQCRRQKHIRHQCRRQKHIRDHRRRNSIPPYRRK
jgi:hypothetical protein